MSQTRCDLTVGGECGFAFQATSPRNHSRCQDGNTTRGVGFQPTRLTSMNESRCDLLVRGGRVVTPRAMINADLAIADGYIVELRPELDFPAKETIDAAGLVVFPGILDAHVHFNEPGRSEWEGLATGSAALAAGGGTAFFDMPLNSDPPVLDAVQFAAKRALASEKSVLDFAIWGGLTRGSLEHLEALRDAGAIGLKAFMCSSGIDGFPRVDTATLREGMKRAAALGLIVAVHAEDETLAARLTADARAAGASDARAWLATRPPLVEHRAIATALELAGETRCALHIVHVSCAESLGMIEEMRHRGVDVSAETCPHYLLLCAEDVMEQGAAAKCAPPLRTAANRESLWQACRDGWVQTIGSDHSPAPPEMKTGADFFYIWGGISGCQHGFPLLMSEALHRDGTDASWSMLARLLAENVHRRFLPGRRKGCLAVGFEADFCLLDPMAPHILTNDELFYRHRQGPYGGRTCRVRVVRTVRRGETVFRDGKIVSGVSMGQFLAPFT